MSGLIGENNGSYPFLNRFSTKTLRQLLREDFTSKEPSTPESGAAGALEADLSRMAAQWNQLQRGGETDGQQET